MQIEAGKRYVKRDGSVSNLIEARATIAESKYQFADSETGGTYQRDGKYTLLEEDHPHDLVSEYTEPVAIEVAPEASDEHRSYWSVPGGDDKHDIRIGSLVILPKGKPNFEEGVLTVSIVDDAAGEYVTIGNAESKHPVGFDPSEWPVVRDAIDFMVGHCRTDGEIK